MARQIVVAVDETEVNERVLATAASLGSRLDDKVLIVHVRQQDPRRGELTLETDEAADRPFLTEAAAQLSGHGIEVDTKSLIGLSKPEDIADAIVVQADTCDAEFIVMGTRARTPVGKMALGSVSLKVLRTANCPVVLVR